MARWRCFSCKGRDFEADRPACPKCGAGLPAVAALEDVHWCMPDDKGPFTSGVTGRRYRIGCQPGRDYLATGAPGGAGHFAASPDVRAVTCLSCKGLAAFASAAARFPELEGGGGEQFIVGQYALTYNSLSLGIFLGEEGYPTLRQMARSKPINSTDKYVKTKIDSIEQGVDYQLQGTMMEYPKALAAGILWPFAPFGQQPKPRGRLKWSVAKVLVLTAVTGTTAENSPATLTANKAIYADDHAPELIFAPDLRLVPLLLDLLPYLDTDGDEVNFVMT